jgi:hypothetical protein
MRTDRSSIRDLIHLDAIAKSDQRFNDFVVGRKSERFRLFDRARLEQLDNPVLEMHLNRRPKPYDIEGRRMIVGRERHADVRD